MNGALAAGLMAITIPCAYVLPYESMIIGVIGGIIVVQGTILIDKIVTLRISGEEELKGLDLSQHGMEAYSGFQIFYHKIDKADSFMKLIIAYIQPHKLNAVKQALYIAEIQKILSSMPLGCGQQKGCTKTCR